MLSLYARIVLWLIRPALELRRTTVKFDFSTAADPNRFRRSRDQIQRELSNATSRALKRTLDSPSDHELTYTFRYLEDPPEMERHVIIRADRSASAAEVPQPDESARSARRPGTSSDQRAGGTKR